jgi:hypothetical protein
MASKQYLLLVLGVIIVASAILFGIKSFRNNHLRNHQTVLINQIASYLNEARLYRKTLEIFGGGNGSYVGFTPAGATSHLSSEQDSDYYRLELINAVYYVQSITEDQLSIIASSKLYGDGDNVKNENNSLIIGTFDGDGQISQDGYVYRGKW